MTNKTENFFSEASGKLLSILGIIFIVLSFVTFLIFGNWEFSNSLNEEKVGQFGDFIGGVVGSLFSLAGVILFYVALKEQRRDININQENLRLQTEALNQQVNEFKEQKIELEETRKIYEEQTGLIREQTNLYRLQNKELKEQTNTSRLQQFDSSFFSYLKVLNDLKANFSSYSSTNLGNPDYFQYLYDQMKKSIIEEQALNLVLEKINEIYFEIFNNERDRLSIYFKTIYRIMHLIDSSNIDEGKKQQYFKLLRSQLSDNEQLILYYNYFSEMGTKVRSYIVRYDLFKHLKILDRLEFRNKIESSNKYKLEKFLNHVSYRVKESLVKFSDIEQPNDIDFAETGTIFEVDFEIKIKIVEKFQFLIIFEKDKFDKNEIISREEFKRLLEIQLYSILFLSQYKSFDGNEITVSVTECNSDLEFKYEVNQIGII
jgi:hypothetical protein